jgi:hypothetical protein
VDFIHLAQDRGKKLGYFKSGNEFQVPLLGEGVKAAGVSPRGQRRQVRRVDNLTTFMCRLSRNPGSLNLLELLGTVQACNGIVLPHFLPSCFIK